MAIQRSLLLTTILTVLSVATYLLFSYRTDTIDFRDLSFNVFRAKPHVALLGSIPKSHVPTPHNGRRLIVVGDIHGMSKPLNRLLEKVSFDPRTDHLVATGDMISKGPDSNGVVARLMELNASAVRGNHEDHVLHARVKLDRHRRKHKKKAKAADDDEWDDDEEDEAGDVDAQRAKARDRQVAKSLTKEHVDWLNSLPIILSAAPLPIYIVHAGLVPGVEVKKQDPWAVMNMRTLLFRKSLELRGVPGDTQEPMLAPGQQEAEPEPTKGDSSGDSDAGEQLAEDIHAQRRRPIPIDGRKGKRWADVWNKYQHRLPARKRKTVIYGHDAKRGHRVGDYTFGLDSGCVAGGELTAVIIEGKQGGGCNYETVQIPCGKA